MENLRWIAAAALSAYACHLAVHQTTPIDQALPLLALAVTFLAWLSYPAVMLGVPLLIVAEIAFPDEQLRLLAFGAIVAAAMGCGLSARMRAGSPRPLVITVIAIVLLRWIPLDHVLLGRELFLLAIAVAIVFVLGRTPFAVAVAVIAALVTPAVPLRTLAFPLAVLLIAAAARTFGLPALRLTWPSTVVLAFVVLFFPWSGIVARAFPYFLREAKPPARRTQIDALAPNKSASYDVPDGAKSIIVSGANVAHLRRGALLGRIEPGGIDVRIGDAADWGYLRREHWYRAHNPLPRDAAGTIREYGYAAWIDGAGRVALPRGARKIRVTADAALPADASLQVEGFE
ncbi:MAG TPA: hypothetical protein VGQ36_24545 [Thermoanaerobaculia bacterium]|nr:hypothetical protein [Thermoanaerobaculia bacterium]